MNFLIGFFIGLFISRGDTNYERSNISPQQLNALYGSQDYQNLVNQFYVQQMQFNRKEEGEEK